MLLTFTLLNKGSFLGSLINKCRPAAVANLSLSTTTYAAKTLEEKVGLPPRPKKPVPPYFRFMGEQRPKVKAANPKLSFIDIVKEISKQWETVDPKLKDRLQEEYKLDQQKYVEARSKYNAKITEEQHLHLRQLKQEQIDAKERRMVRQRIKELGRPKKPASSFLRFITKERTVTPQAPNETYKEWHKKTTEKWRSLTDAEKSVYGIESRKELDIYKKEISLWEEEMIRLGHIDVVRNVNLIDPPEPKSRKR